MPGLPDDLLISDALTDSQRRAAYALRYAVYAEERALGNLASADHANRMLQDPLDETGLILLASRGDEVVGSVRLNTSARTRFSDEFRRIYRADAFEERAPGAVSYSGRLVVRRDQRRSNVFQALVNAHYKQALDHGVEYMLWNCTPALIGLYERLGGRRYAPNFVDKDMGYRVPMVVAARDGEHFKRVRSPWGRILAQTPERAAAPGDYQWLEDVFGKQFVGEFRLEDEAFWSFLAARLMAADLHAIPLLEGLSEKERIDVLERSTVIRYRKGDLVVRAGDYSEEMYIVLSGSLEAVDPGGRHLTDIAVGEIFGEIGWVTHSRRTADVRGREDGDLLVLTHVALERLMQNAPPLAARVLFNLSRLLCERLVYRAGGARGEDMEQESGSYDFGKYEERDAELRRLEAQAAATWAVEAPVVVAAGLARGQRVLDLGCGPGFLARKLAEAVGPSGAVVGVDVSDALLAVARALPPMEGVAPITYHRGSAYALDMPDGSVDFIYSRLLFQHLEDPQRVIRECGRVLRPGGAMCVVDSDDGILGLFPEPPGYAEFTRRAAELQKARGGDRDVGRKVGWYYKRAGFTDVRVDVRVVTSDTMSMKSFLDVAVSFKRELFPPAERAAAAERLESFRRYMDQPEGFGLAGLYLVSARKPIGN